MLGGGSKLVSCSLSGKQPLTRCYASQFNRYFLNDELRSVTRFAIKSQYTDILNDPEIHAKDSGFSVCCLGTGSGLANLARGNAATALRINGKVFLFDVGEATQRQLMKSTMTVGQVTRIFSKLYVYLTNSSGLTHRLQLLTCMPTTSLGYQAFCST